MDGNIIYDFYPDEQHFYHEICYNEMQKDLRDIKKQGITLAIYFYDKANET